MRSGRPRLHGFPSADAAVLNQPGASEELSAWALPRPAIGLCAGAATLGTLYTFKYGWNQRVYIATGLSLAVSTIATAARAGRWTKPAMDGVPVVSMLLVIAALAAIWPLLLILGGLAAELYLLYRGLRYLVAGSSALAAGLMLYLLYMLAPPLLILGLFLMAWLLSALVGTPVYW